MLSDENKVIPVATVSTCPGFKYKVKPIPRRPARLSVREQAKLECILLKGPLQASYPTDLWTLRQVTEVIEQRSQVWASMFSRTYRYHSGHVWKLLVSMGWSCQKPEGRSTQRDEPTIEHWKRYKWPTEYCRSAPEVLFDETVA